MPDTKSDLEPFVTHVLRGARFEGRSVPLTVLPDLTAYRDLVVEVARVLFFRENPERQRVPRGFEEGFELVLRGIGEGSAVVPLERRKKPIPLQLPLLSVVKPDLFDQARDVVNLMIEASNTGGMVPVEFPVEALKHFNNFGRTLRDDESIEISGPVGRPRASYNKRTRKRLVLLKEGTYEDAVEITGRVVQFDTQRRIFGIVDKDLPITGSLEGLSARQLGIVRTAAVHTEQLLVYASGIGAFDQLDRLVRLVSIKEISFAEDEDLRERLDVDRRLAELADLGDGWLDGSGVAIASTTRARLASFLKEAEREGLSRPYLYPTPEGAIQAEWSYPDAEVSALFDAEMRAVSCVGVVTKSGAHLDEDIDLREPQSGIRKLIKFVNRFAP